VGLQRSRIRERMKSAPPMTAMRPRAPTKVSPVGVRPSQHTSREVVGVEIEKEGWEERMAARHTVVDALNG
jgi:hypothetical protein